MPSLIVRAIKLARTPQGRILLKQARKVAADPKTRKQLQDIASRLAKSAKAAKSARR